MENDIKLSRSQERRIAVQKGESLTDNKKDKLLRLWAGYKWPDVSDYWQEYNVELLVEDCSDKTISEIKALMIKAGVDQVEINKIIGV